MKELIFITIVLIIIRTLAKSHKKRTEEEKSEQLDLQYKYQQKWLFTYNEKDAYWKLKQIAEKNNYILFAKVRLLDLIEPIRESKKYITYMNKIQSKHVDFVLCDKKLVARLIIELDDNSHTSQKREERDKFVDAAVKAAGYRILHVRAIEEDTIQKFINEKNG